MYTCLGLILFLTITVANGARFSENVPLSIERLPSRGETNVGAIDICQDCIKEWVSVINVLLNLILDEGIIGSCGDLCSALQNRTNSSIDGDICLALCNAVGIVEFCRILEHSDLDPIWYCQIMDLCPSKKEM